MINLGALEKAEGRIGEARNWYTKAIAAGPDQAPMAMFNLGVLERKVGRIGEARRWYIKVVESGHPEGMKRAQEQLAEMRRYQDGLQRAENFTKYGHSFVDADFTQPPSRGEIQSDSPDDGTT